MKYVLLIWYAAGLTTGQMTTTIGPYDNLASCQKVRLMLEEARWEARCYPIGDVK